MKKISFLFYATMSWIFLLLGCSTVGVQDISSSENGPNKKTSGENISSSETSKTPLTKEEEISVSSDKTTSENHSSSETNKKKTPRFYTAINEEGGEVECWNCKGGTVRNFTCQAQSFNTEDLPPGVGYYCKIGRLRRFNDKAKNEAEAEEDLGLCPQCLGTRQSKCWICHGKGRFVPK